MIHYSQRDPRWANWIIGQTADKTMSEYGCLLCCIAMVCTEFGHDIDPAELNEKYRGVGGFDGANLIIRYINSFYPTVFQEELIPCGKDIDAPLSLIDELITYMPVIVQLDSSPVEGHQEHWVVITGKQNGDYIIQDPWELESNGTFLIDRYGFDSKDPAKIITSVLVLGHTQAQQDDCNAAVVAPYGVALRNAPHVAFNTFLTYLPYTTRIKVSNNVIENGGYRMREVICYMAEHDTDGTELLRIDE